MFVPAFYRADSEEWPRRIIRDHALATLTTNGADVPYATHLPSLLAPGVPEGAPLVGSELIGHMNRSNPHWRSLTDGMRALMVFQGPGCYVTPTVYRTNPAAPTWDFVSVHLRGRLRLVQGEEQTFQIILATVERLESTFRGTWDPASSLEYFRQILPGVGAFRLEIEAVDTMLKLSQEKTVDVQELVIQSFEDGDGNGPQLARMMREYGLGAMSGEART